MTSIWKRHTHLPERAALPKDKKVQTVVIGGGMAGILIAYLLQRRGREVIIVEAKRVASGQTGNTTAKITSQHGLIYDKLIRKIGKERAREYANANEDAIQMYAKIIEEEKIDCDFERLPAYLHTMHRSGLSLLRKEAKAAKELGLPARLLEGIHIGELPFYVEGALCFERQAQFHPLKFLGQLAQKLEVYENTKVLAVRGHKVLTNNGIIVAENIVFASHYPITNVPGFYFLRQHQERSYVVALEKQKKLTGMYYGIDEDGLSFRSDGETLLVGGGAHRTGKVSKYAHPCEKQGYGFLRGKVQNFYPKAIECAAWAAQDCMPHDGVPFIGRYSLFRPYWYVATGFQKWGMTSSMVAAVTISRLICGGPDPYGKVFSPQRCYVRAGYRNFLTDIGENVRGLCKGFFGGKRHRCTHMGCKLEWNEEEQSYDCPCHGSRYGENGEIMDNPARKDK